MFFNFWSNKRLISKTLKILQILNFRMVVYAPPPIFCIESEKGGLHKIKGIAPYTQPLWELRRVNNLGFGDVQRNTL